MTEYTPYDCYKVAIDEHNWLASMYRMTISCQNYVEAKKYLEQMKMTLEMAIRHLEEAEVEDPNSLKEAE